MKACRYFALRQCGSFGLMHTDRYQRPNFIFSDNVALIRHWLCDNVAYFAYMHNKVHFWSMIIFCHNVVHENFLVATM